MPTGLFIYFCLVACVAVQRLLEVRLASRNTERLLLLGAREFESRHYRVMKVLHTTWLLACIAEALWRSAPPQVGLAVISLVLFAMGQLLRVAAIKELGPRWTTRIIVLPAVPPEAGGIYRLIKHPNYLGVILEIAALPLLFGSWVTAVVFSVANLALLLGVRIPAEETAIKSNNASSAMTEWSRRGRFVPGRS
ncbi:MAG: isoprenylcysteine carboxylmethyltransferase family protein [Myxococcota bacterium]|nr:isoprenylcysteine carboxylmethyltransferase family protein [Myxococcota bacterium]